MIESLYTFCSLDVLCSTPVLKACTLSHNFSFISNSGLPVENSTASDLLTWMSV